MVERLRVMLMKEALSYGRSNKKRTNFIKLLISELDADTKRNEIDDTDSFIKIIKSAQKNLKIVNTEESIQELKYLQPYLDKYLPKQIDIDKELKLFIDNNKDTNLNIGLFMKYFSSNFKGQYDGKELSNKVRKLLV